jgi:hypothetical protein
MRKLGSKDLKSAGGVPNCTGCAVYFSRQSVLMGPELKLRFAQPSESQRSRNRFRYRNARNQPTQNIAAKERTLREDLDSD